ncbi:hypothetical protein GW918_01645 [Candidatus Berkelbacteria bacterium]|nr:hypothetical protein [Candidatus Berkelbacteria bacterium]
MENISIEDSEQFGSDPSLSVEDEMEEIRQRQEERAHEAKKKIEEVLNKYEGEKNEQN